MYRMATTAFAAPLMMAGGIALAQESPVGSPPPAATTTVLSRTVTTATGQPLGLPPAPVEIVVSRVELPPGGLLPMHKHPWQRYAYIERGRILVRYEAAGIEREYGAGEVIVEAVDQWHEGRAVGAEPVLVIVIDHVPPGRNNVVRR